MNFVIQNNSKFMRLFIMISWGTHYSLKYSNAYRPRKEHKSSELSIGTVYNVDYPLCWRYNNGKPQRIDWIPRKVYVYHNLRKKKRVNFHGEQWKEISANFEGSWKNWLEIQGGQLETKIDILNMRGGGKILIFIWKYH